MKTITEMLDEADTVLNGRRSILAQVLVNLLTIFALCVGSLIMLGSTFIFLSCAT